MPPSSNWQYLLNSYMIDLVTTGQSSLKSAVVGLDSKDCVAIIYLRVQQHISSSANFYFTPESLSNRLPEEILNFNLYERFVFNDPERVKVKGNFKGVAPFGNFGNRNIDFFSQKFFSTVRRPFIDNSVFGEPITEFHYSNVRWLSNYYSTKYKPVSDVGVASSQLGSKSKLMLVFDEKLVNRGYSSEKMNSSLPSVGVPQTALFGSILGESVQSSRNRPFGDTFFLHGINLYRLRNNLIFVANLKDSSSSFRSRFNVSVVFENFMSLFFTNISISETFSRKLASSVKLKSEPLFYTSFFGTKRFDASNGVIRRLPRISEPPEL